MLEQIVEIPQEQVVMTFVSTCIEAMAKQMGLPYDTVFERIESVGMIDGYIVPHYDMLHTESRENLASGLIECLNNWENRKCKAK